MKKKKLLIQITEPCQEAWDGMTPGSSGRYCGSCDKTVIDFVGKSDPEIVRLIQNKEGFQQSRISTCGRFTQDQLNRSIQIPEEEKSPDLLKWLAGLLLAGSTMQSFSQELIDSTQNNSEITRKVSLSLPDSLTPITDSTNYLQFYGKVVDKDNNGALSGVTIELTGSNLKTSSDKNGDFSLLIPSGLVPDTSTLIFAFYFENFEPKSLFRTADELGKKEKVKLTSHVLSTICFVSGNVNVVLGNFIPSAPSEQEKQITELIDLIQTDAETQKSQKDSVRQLKHSKRESLPIPILQAILPMRRRRRK